MKFRKIPVVIEATQWFPGVVIEGVEEIDGEDIGRIKTLEDITESYHYVSPGDWVITGVAGEKYPCKPDIFALTYEVVE